MDVTVNFDEVVNSMAVEIANLKKESVIEKAKVSSLVRRVEELEAENTQLQAQSQSKQESESNSEN